MEFKPSYQVYREILRAVKATGKSMGYKEAVDKEEFVIMRHDVEFSLDRAYQLSLVETEEEFHSTFFVQFTNNSYN